MQIDSSTSGTASSIYDELRSGKSSSSVSLQDADASSSTSNASGTTLSLSDILGQRARLRAQMEQNGQMGMLQSNLGSSATGGEDTDALSASASASSSSSNTATASNASMTSNVGQMFMPPPPQGMFDEEGMQSDSGEGMYADMFDSAMAGSSSSSSSLGASAMSNYWLRQRASSAYEGIDGLIGGQSSDDSQAVSLDA